MEAFMATSGSPTVICYCQIAATSPRNDIEHIFRISLGYNIISDLFLTSVYSISLRSLPHTCREKFDNNAVSLINNGNSLIKSSMKIMIDIIYAKLETTKNSSCTR